MKLNDGTVDYVAHFYRGIDPVSMSVGRAVLCSLMLAAEAGFVRKVVQKKIKDGRTTEVRLVAMNKLVKEDRNNRQPADPTKGWIGVTLCSFKDEFDVLAGCKKALAMALERSGLDKESRTALWMDYFTKVRELEIRREMDKFDYPPERVRDFNRVMEDLNHNIA